MPKQRFLFEKLLHADDAIFISHNVEDMELIMGRFSSACTAFWLTKSLKRIKTMFTPAPGESYNKPNIVINGNRLDVVDTFAYLRDICLETDLWILKYNCKFKKHLLPLKNCKREYGPIVLFL